MGNKDHPCRLCGTTSKSGIEIFSNRGVKLSMKSILEQHFLIELIESDESNIVCKKCWKITAAFHQLYCLVKDVVVNDIKHDKISVIQLSPIPQTETVDEDSMDEEQVDFTDVEVKLEPYDYNAFDSNVRATSNPTQQSELELKEENSQQKCKIEGIDRSREKPVEVTKQLSEKQLQIIEQDNEIQNSLAIICELCNTTCNTFLELKQHFMKKHKPVTGYIRCCERKYRYRSELYEHIKNHKNPDRLQCLICEKKFVDNANLKIHMKRHDPTFKKIKCPECPKLFENKSYLKYHVEWVHFTGPRSFICEICGKSFISKFTVSSHLLGVHVRKNSQVCDMCGKTFRNAKLLDTHYKTQHLGIRSPKVQCSLCGTWLCDKNVLRKHMRYHYAKDETCPDCGKIAPNRNALRTHVRKVHSGQIFSCTMCEKKFKSKKSLAEHISTHTGFNLYQCTYCPMEFNYESSLYKHRKDVHPIELEEDRRQKINTRFTQVKKIEKV